MADISVIIPVYKIETYLDRCVRSVVAQTYRDLEIILVDDGSPDRCPALCDAWAARDPRIQVVHRQNGGLSAARNTGIDRATGDFLAFVDGDDFLEPEMLQRLWDARQRSGAELVLCNLRYVSEDGIPLEAPDFSGFRDEILEEGAFWHRYYSLAEQRIYYVVAWNKLYKATLFKTVRYRPGKRYEDQFILPELISQCHKIACLGYTGYNYVQHSGSIMAQGSSRGYLDRSEFLLEWTDYFARKGDFARAEGLLNDAIQNLAEKDRFDLSTLAQQRRYRVDCNACAAAYRALAGRTGRQSMWLRALLLHASLPLYLEFLHHRTPKKGGQPPYPPALQPCVRSHTAAISIIVPAYKIEPYLDRCVRSLVDQSFTDLEIILVDDGSPDRCPALCDAWAAKDARIKVIHQKNAGLSAARNAGIALSSGLFLSFVDGDDFLERETMARLYAAQLRTGAEMVIYNLRYVDENGTPQTVPDFTMFRDEVLEESQLWQHYYALAEQRIYYVIACNKLYKAELFDTVRYRPGKRYEDQFILPELISQCHKIACLGYTGYNYVQHSGSIMAQGSSRGYLDRSEFLLEWTDYFARKGDFARAEGLLNDAIQNLAEKDRFDLSTLAQQRRYRVDCNACAAAYRALAGRTGRQSMWLRAALLRISLPLYLTFLHYRTTR